MNTRLFINLAMAFIFFTNAIADNGYKFSINLNNAQKEALTVELITPQFSEQVVIYRLPAMVPGTYAIYNFGRFVKDFHAYAKDGRELEVKHNDLNSWTINDAAELVKISYKVRDTWNADTSNFIFEPAGSNFDNGKNILINTHALFGYFDNYKKLPFNISITKPEEFYGSTALISTNSKATTDNYTTANYMELTDSPLMYNKPDTSWLHMGGADILVSVYDQAGKTGAKSVARDVKLIMEAASDYLGGKLPVKKYAYLIYLYKGKSHTGASGALEHSYSSVYYLPSGRSEEIAKMVKDIASHEFFHVVTPLNIHSEEIGDFDYANPRMSQHLWLYEGSTEYNAHYAQLRKGIISLEQFMAEVRDKMNTAQGQFNDSLSFTEMSKGALDKHKQEYQNVYYKGALITMCLDIKLRKLSGGKYGFIDLINDLSKEFGKERSFKDDELFAKIEKLTYPEIATFFKEYVQDGKFLPFDEILADIGVDYKRKGTRKGFSTFGGAGIGLNYPKSKFLYAKDVNKLDSLGKELGIQKDDIFFKLNGKRLSLLKIQKVINKYQATVKEGDSYVLIVKRKDEQGKLRKVKLVALAKKVDIPQNNLVKVRTDISAEQQKIRNSWMGKA